MLEQIHDHVRRGESFAFETTLSGRGYARLIPSWQERGYRVKLIFLGPPTPDMAIARVRERVREGGHDVPQAVIRRRFDAGLSNFDRVYRAMVDESILYDKPGEIPILLDEGHNL
jgi:predicted ABC-type ATPase